MTFDWFGALLTFIIVSAIILFIWAKLQGDKVVDILREIRDFLKEGGKK